MNLEELILKKVRDEGTVLSVNTYTKKVEKEFTKPFSSSDLTTMLVHLSREEMVLPVFEKDQIVKNKEVKGITEVLFYEHLNDDRPNSGKRGKLRRRMKRKIDDPDLIEKVISDGKENAIKRGWVSATSNGLIKTDFNNLKEEDKYLIKSVLDLGTDISNIDEYFTEEGKCKKFPPLSILLSLIESEFCFSEDWKLLPGPEVSTKYTLKFDLLFLPRIDSIFRHNSAEIVLEKVLRFLPVKDFHMMRLTNQRIYKISEKRFLADTFSKFRRTVERSESNAFLILEGHDEKTILNLFPLKSIFQKLSDQFDMDSLVDRLIDVLINSTQQDNLYISRYLDSIISLLLHISSICPSRITKKKTEILELSKHCGFGTVDFYYGEENISRNKSLIDLLSVIGTEVELEVTFDFHELPTDTQRIVASFLPTKSLVCFRLINKHFEIITRKMFIDRAKNHFKSIKKELISSLDVKIENLYRMRNEPLRYRWKNETKAEDLLRKWCFYPKKFLSFLRPNKEMIELFENDLILKEDVMSECISEETIVEVFINAYQKGISGSDLMYMQQMLHYFCKLRPDLILRHRDELRRRKDFYSGRYSDKWNNEIDRIVDLANQSNERIVRKKYQYQKYKIPKNINSSMSEIELKYLLSEYLRDQRGVLGEGRDLGIWFNLFKFGDEVQYQVLSIYLKMMEKYENPEFLKRQPLKGCIDCLWTNGYLAGLRNKKYGSQIFRIMERLMKLYFHDDFSRAGVLFEYLKTAIRKDYNSDRIGIEKRLLDGVTPICGRWFPEAVKVLKLLVFCCDVKGRECSGDGMEKKIISGGRIRCVTCGKKDYCENCFVKDEHEGHKFYGYR